MKTCNSAEFFAKKVNFYYRNAIFLLLLPESEFLQTFGTINAHNNEEFTIKS